MRPFLPVLVAAAIVGCGGSDSGSAGPGDPAKLLLDFQPNGVHAGIYVAAERGYDDTEGAPLDIQKPGQSTDALKLLQSGGADVAVLDIHDLGLARAKGADLVGVMAIVQRPLAAVFAQPRIDSPKDLAGEKVGVSGLPSDVAVLDAVVKGDGGDPEEVEQITIGFEAVKALISDRVAAATAFWNAEGVALKARRPGIKEFRVDDYGAPPYPELVLVTTRTTLQERKPMVRAVVRALQRGYLEAQADPEQAASAMLDAEPELDREILDAELDAVAPAFTAGARFPGELRMDVLEQWAAFDLEFGILDEPLDATQAFDPSLAGPISRD